MHKMHVHLYFANIYAKESKGIHTCGQGINTLNSLSICRGLCILLNVSITIIP